MKLLALAAAFTALIPSTLAARAIVQNRCTFPIYVRAVGPAAPNGNTLTLAAGTGTYSEPLTGSGNTIFAGVTQPLPHPMQFDFSVTDNTYYDLSVKGGNSFQANGFSLVPAVTSCHAIHCAPNTQYCSDVFNPTGNSAVFACTPSSDLTFILCG